MEEHLDLNAQPDSTGLPSQSQELRQEEQFYTGSWERKGRSPFAAAIIMLLVIGMLYFNLQVILMIPVMIWGRIAQPLTEGGTILQHMSESMRRMATPLQVMLLICQYAFMLAPTIYFVRKLHTKHVREYLRYSKTSILEILLAVVTTLALIPFTTWIANILTRLLDVPDEIANLGIELFTANSLPEFFWLVLVIAITPAICEEALFRGYAQRTLERAIGAKSFWVIGIIFGLYHMQPLGLISLSIIGIVLGFFYYRSKSLFPSMAAHFTNNFFVVWLLYSGGSIGGVNLAGIDDVPILWAVLSLAVSGGLLYAYHVVTAKKALIETV